MTMISHLSLPISAFAVYFDFEVVDATGGGDGVSSAYGSSVLGGFPNACRNKFKSVLTSISIDSTLRTMTRICPLKKTKALSVKNETTISTMVS